MFRAKFSGDDMTRDREDDGMSTLCAACGNSIEAGDQFCRVCGRQASPTGGAAGIPTGAAGPAETSVKAIISLVCGVLFFVPLAFIGAIVFGHLGLSEIKKSAGRLKGEGIAIAGLVLGYLWIAGIPLILIVAAIAIPNLLRARMAANESSAVAEVRQLVASEVTYSTSHPEEGFTCSLPALEKAGVLTGALASGQKNGYAFELTGCAPGAEGGPNMKYQVVAYPVRLNQTGVRAFCSDESAVVKVDAGGSAEKCVQSGESLR
jgi:type IV pilus assembly protein PilA